MPTRQVNENIVEDLRRQLEAAHAEINRLRNNKSPTMPTYASTGLPDDAIEGAFAIADSITGNPGRPTVFFFYDGEWRELCSCTE